MHKVSIAAAVSAALFAGPAFARDSGFYIGADLGAVISAESDQTWTPGRLAGSTGRISTDHETGFNASAFLGYDFGMFRLEVEAGYLSADIDKVTSDFTTGGSGLASGSQSADGEVMTRSFMANVIVDIGAVDGFEFFVGGGAGVAKLEFSDVTLGSGAVLLDDEGSDWLFAWQAMAGVRKPLSDRVDLHVRYRYVDVDDAELIGLAGRAVSAGLSAHSLSVGLSFNF